MPHAFILGGNGQIGVATASHLLDSGWTVTIAHRGLRPLPAELVKRGAKVVTLDRDQPGALARQLSSGADALIDVVAYGPEHARQLLAIQDAVGSIIVISSSSVYRDESGRTLDEAAETGFPELPVPITESQPTVEPSSKTYSTRKAALEQVLLDGASVSATVLRPAAVSGIGSTHPREWWFVKRFLDQRRNIPLAYGGLSIRHAMSNFNGLEVTEKTLSRGFVHGASKPFARPRFEVQPQPSALWNGRRTCAKGGLCEHAARYSVFPHR